MNRQRQALLDRLEASGEEFAWYLSHLSTEDVHAAPAPNEWSLHQAAAHVRDCEDHVFLRRIELVLYAEHPAVQNFDQDEYWKTHPYASSEALKDIVADFRKARRKMLKLLRNAPESAWKNWAHHSAYGRISLEWLVLHCYHHTLEHIAQMGYAREKGLLKKLND